MDNHAIISKYLKGNSIWEISKKCHLSEYTISQLLKSAKVVIRHRGRVGAYPKLTSKEKGIIIGTLLGDGHFICPRKTHSLGISHGGKQKEYILWKAKELKKIGVRIYPRNRYDKRTKKYYEEYQFRSKSHPFLKYLYEQFYKSGLKQPNQKILNMLTDEGVAIWYCDDGSLYVNKRTGYHIYLGINAFNNKKEIINWFRDKYELNFKINQKAIRITGKSQIKLFMDLFGKYIPKCMEDKKVKL